MTEHRPQKQRTRVSALHEQICPCDRTTLVSIFLGIDGGGSKTTCIIGDEHSLLSTGTSAGSNVVRVGERQARETLGAAVRQACAAANITPGQIDRTCVGIAGGARPEIAAVVLRLLSEFISGEIEVVGDMVIALEAAFGSGPGVIVIAGTGSIAYGRNSAGEIARAGGWGFAISDEGSGHWIGRSAVAASMRAYEGGDASTGKLLDSIIKSWGLATRWRHSSGSTAITGSWIMPRASGSWPCFRPPPARDRGHWVWPWRSSCAPDRSPIPATRFP